MRVTDAWLLSTGATPVSRTRSSLSLRRRIHNEADRVPFARLRDAYLEPWGGDVDTFELALRVGWGAYAIAWLRQYDHLESHEQRTEFMREFSNVLREAYSAAA